MTVQHIDSHKLRPLKAGTMQDSVGATGNASPVSS